MSTITDRVYTDVKTLVIISSLGCVDDFGYEAAKQLNILYTQLYSEMDMVKNSLRTKIENYNII